jgi:hypothetical protein
MRGRRLPGVQGWVVNKNREGLLSRDVRHATSLARFGADC